MLATVACAMGCATTRIESSAAQNGYGNFHSDTGYFLLTTEDPGEQWVLYTEGIEGLVRAQGDVAYIRSLYGSAAQLSQIAVQQQDLVQLSQVFTDTIKVPPVQPDTLSQAEFARLNRYCDDHGDAPGCVTFFGLVHHMYSTPAGETP